MELYYWVLFGYFFLIMLPRLPAIKAAIIMDGHYSLDYPRAQQSRLTGVGLRAQSAHLNSLEAFPGFAVAVWLAVEFNGSIQWLNGLALGFFIARILYIICYLMDLNPYRTLVWSIAFFINVGIFILPLCNE